MVSSSLHTWSAAETHLAYEDS